MDYLFLDTTNLDTSASVKWAVEDNQNSKIEQSDEESIEQNNSLKQKTVPKQEDSSSSKKQSKCLRKCTNNIPPFHFNNYPLFAKYRGY